MKPLHRLLAVLSTLLLLSCGGGTDFAGNGGGGVGTGGTGIVAGTVTGLGSVVVEDTRFDESQAVLESRPDLVRSNALALADLHIGQYAYLDLDAAGTPTRVRIESQLVGSVAGVNAATGRFTVWGHPAVINTDPDRGPVTVFSGFAGIADMQPGDAVQVYGVLQASDGTTDLLRATRIEKLAAVGALPARVTGTLRQGAGTTLLLAGRPLDVSGAANVPALGAGTAVIAVVPWTAQLPATWQASAVALLAPSAAASSLRVSGAVHLLPDGRASVQGVEVDLSTLTQQDRDAVREGSYLTIQGRSRGSDSRRADAARIEALPQGGRTAQLRGSITSVGTATFVVRGQTVDASAAQFVGGSAANLTVGTYVEVQGAQAAAGVAAQRVTFPGVPPERAVLELRGTVQSVDAAGRTARLLARDGRSFDLVLPAQGALPAVGDAIRAEGYWDGSRLQVREFRPDNAGAGEGEDR
ncbi:DUF5666 domain-containing protein [Ramlibacter sp. AN1133]|uniref:DUF5666 domain-containing protein n=1 Tax=Ramlibacter sp. AN1133 TaxID=3133429 RepID=UPI0030BD9A2D